MLLERPLSLKQIFHNHTQINRQRDRIIRMQQLTYKFFSSFFFFIFSSSTLHCFLLFCSFRAGPFLLLLMVCSCFYFFLLLSIQHFSLSLFVDVVLWCLKLSFTVTRFVLNPWRTLLTKAPNWTMLYSHLHVHAASQWHNDKDTWRKTQEWRTHEGFFRKIFTSHFIARVRKGCSRFCMREGAGDRT